MQYVGVSEQFGRSQPNRDKVRKDLFNVRPELEAVGRLPLSAGFQPLPAGYVPAYNPPPPPRKGNKAIPRIVRGGRRSRVSDRHFHHLKLF